MNELAATTSRKEKESILIQNMDNVLLQKVLEAALNPFRTYNIKKIPDYKCMNETMGSPLGKAIQSLSIFENRDLTGNAALTKLSSILSSLSEEDAEVYSRIIKKDLDVGIGANTVNKIWIDLIPTCKYMGATPMSDKALDGLNWIDGVYAQNKEDGLFNFAMVSNGVVKHFGRSGKEYDFGGAFDFLSDEFYGCRIDGEIRVWNKDRTEFLPRKESNGIVNKFQVGKKEHNEDPTRLCFIIWDSLPISDAIAGKCVYPYSLRYKLVREAIKNTLSRHNGDIEQHKKPTIRIVKTQIVQSLVAAKEMYKSVKSKGEEGLILKNSDGIWIDGKPNHQVKLKNASECEMKITGFNENKKKAGRLGAFSLASADGKIVTNCGSGLTDELAIEYWNNQESLLGRVVSIKFESIISKDGEELLSMNLPIFVELREDKDIADDLNQIIEIWESDNGCKVTTDISSKL